MSEERDSLVAFVGGDAEGARSLRAALEALRGAPAGDPPQRAKVDDALAGRSSMRELAQEPVMRELAERGLDQLRRELAEMPPEDRADLARRAAAHAAATDPDQR